MSLSPQVSGCEPRDLPVWRSMLFVPATNRKLVESALRRDPDAFQIDLEDAVPLDRKAEARGLVGEIAGMLAGRGADILVRINRPWRMAIADIEASVGPHVDALNLPKVPDGSYVRLVAEVLDELELERGLPQGKTKIIAMIETAEGLLNMREIASASPRVVAITIGAEDLALDLGMEPEADGLYGPNMQLVAVARAAGILPIGYLGSVAQFADLGAFREVVTRSKKLGFAGGFAIHPNQLPVLQEAFSPGPDAVAEAEALVAAYQDALAAGKGAITHEGKMIDQPVADRARALLNQARKIAEKDRRKGFISGAGRAG